MGVINYRIAIRTALEAGFNSAFLCEHYGADSMTVCGQPRVPAPHPAAPSREIANRRSRLTRNLVPALRPGQDEVEDLTVETGLRKMEAHGEASLPRDRVRASGCAGVSRRRNASWTGQAPRPLTPSDPTAGSETPCCSLRRGCGRRRSGGFGVCRSRLPGSTSSIRLRTRTE